MSSTNQSINQPINQLIHPSINKDQQNEMTLYILNNNKINVMMTVQELIDHLQQKIQTYRNQQAIINLSKSEMKATLNLIVQINKQIKDYIRTQLGSYKDMYQEAIRKINDYFQFQMQRQRRSYERQNLDLQSQIERQYKVISNMRQEVEDLQELIIMQNAKKQCSQSIQQRQSNRLEEQQRGCEIQKIETIYGLEVIEQETQRTIVSTKQLLDQDNNCHEHFMKIEEWDNQQSYCSLQQFSNLQESNQGENRFSNNQFVKIQQPSSVSQDSAYNIQQELMILNVSKRKKSFQAHQDSEQTFQKYQSEPAIDEHITKQFVYQPQNNQSLYIRNQLRQIPQSKNQIISQKQREAKIKAFLQDFRKTFNKCLSSTSISRKLSSKGQNMGKKSKNEQKRKSSRQKLSRTGDMVQNKNKYINDMLKGNQYNDNKFTVGNQSTQLRYDGQRKGNSRHGIGQLFYSNGLSYQGEFKNNLRSGYGILRFNQIEIYRGQWAEDELWGQGKLRNFAVINKSKTNTNQSPLAKWISYCGYFKNNRFEGEGTIYLQGAQKFLGKFICGCACGEGTLYKKNGEVQTGIWRNNLLSEKF